MKHLEKSTPFLYLEHGALYRKDENIIFENKEQKIHVPLDSFIVILIGTGVSISSNAISHITKKNCSLCISSSDQFPKSFLTCFSDIGNPEYTLRQIEIFNNRKEKLDVARKLISEKFNDESFLLHPSTNRLMLAEARNTKRMYKAIFGKDFKRSFERDADYINAQINIANNAIYNYCGAVVHMMGLSPHIGFLHGKVRNALILDLSELFKTEDYYKIFSNSLPIKDMLIKVRTHTSNKHKKLMEFICNVFSYSEEP